MTRLNVCVAFLLLLASSAAAQPSPATSGVAAVAPAPVLGPAVAGVPGTSAPETPLPSFGSLFRDLGSDVRHLPTWQHGAILGIAGAASLAVHGEDGDITRRAAHAPALDMVFESGDVLGSGALHGGLAAATFALGHALGNIELATVGADLARAQLLTAVMTQGLKLSVNRHRPDGTRFSFPSGHASATFATATVLQRHYGWKVGVPAYGMAAYVGASRLQENRHYMSDVIFGAALGAIGGRAVTVGHGTSTFALTPIAGPHGSGVGLTLIGAR